MKTESYTAVYAGFAVFAFAFLWHYFPQGFSLYDDAYLLGLARRIVDGEALYRDISYLRTPLSPLIQAGWLAALGDSYTVLFSRGVWGAELCGVIVVASFLYREHVSRLVLFLVLCLSLVYASLLIAFPWYSYDAAFFAVLFTVALWKRRPFVAGVFAGLSFLCKQSFVALIPVTFIVWLVLALVVSGNVKRCLSGIALSLGGWSLTALAMTVIMSFRVSPATLWKYVAELPAGVNDLGVRFLIWQDIPAAFAESWLIVLMVVVSLALDRGRGHGVFGIILTIALFWEGLTASETAAPYFFTTLTYTLFLIWIAGNWIERRRFRDAYSGPPSRTLVFVSAGAAVTYCSGMNYSGIIFSHTGAVLTIPIVLLLAGEVSRLSELLAFGDVEALTGSRDSPKPAKKLLAQAGLAIALLTVAFTAHERFPYLESPRDELTAEFSTPALAGIRSSAERAAEIDSLVEVTKDYCMPGEEFLAFPEPACLNYLSGRRAYGPIQWWYRREFTKSMADSVVREIEVDPPSLVVKGREMHADIHRKGASILSLLSRAYKPIDSVGGYYILVPRERVGAENGESGGRER